jgi:uncharacterized protein with PIN domain
MHPVTMKNVTLRFYEELNDFLPAGRKKQSFEVAFRGRQTVKDIIESNGVPHIEVDLILVNGQPKEFGYLVCDGDRISVYPVFETFNISPVNVLRRKPLRKTAFILDVHLGRLKKYLRIFGFDTLYRNDYRDEEIVEISNKEHRIILTRDVGLLKRNKVRSGYWVRNIYPRLQVREIVERFDLYDSVDPFRRCSDCNGMIGEVSAESVSGMIKPRTRRYFDVFFQCAGCGKIYWKGSHYTKMCDFISEILSTQQDKNV